MAVPSDGGADDSEDDSLALLKSDISKARGKALLVETVASAWGEGRQAAPNRDWVAARLGPTPTAPMVEIADSAFNRMLAACGTSPALFDNSSGISKREALRQYHMSTVRPCARILEHELSLRLDTKIRLRFDNYPLDLAGLEVLDLSGNRIEALWPLAVL